MAKRKKSFAEVKKNFPQDITYEMIAKQFLQLSRVNIQDPIKLIKAKIILLGIMRNGVRQVNPKYVYNSPQHRDEVTAAIIEALESLEEELEELEEEAFLEEEEEEDLDIDLGDFSLDLDL